MLSYIVVLYLSSTYLCRVALSRLGGPGSPGVRALRHAHIEGNEVNRIAVSLCVNHDLVIVIVFLLFLLPATLLVRRGARRLLSSTGCRRCRGAFGPVARLDAFADKGEDGLACGLGEVLCVVQLLWDEPAGERASESVTVSWETREALLCRSGE